MLWNASILGVTISVHYSCNSIAVLMLIFICGGSHKSTQFCFILCMAYLSFLGTSVSAKYTLLGVKYHHENSFKNIRTDVKIRIFAIPIAYFSGFGIFKQNQGSPDKITKDDYQTGCGNVSHCQQQQSYSGLHSPRWSYLAYSWNDSCGLNLSQDQNGWTLETFRFEDENDYEYEIWPKDFLHILTK